MPRAVTTMILPVVLVMGGCGTGVDSSYQPYQSLKQAESATDSTTASTGAADAGATPNEPAASQQAHAAVVESDVAEIPCSALAPLNVVDGSSIADVLSVRPQQASTEKPASAVPVPDQSTGPRSIELLVAKREFAPEGSEGALRVSYDDLDLLKILNMEPVPADAVTHFPDWLNQLSGKQIRIRGFMYPTYEATGIEQFVLARDNQICCFGRNPKVYDLIAVEMKPGATTNYIPNRPFDVVGTFRIDLLAEDDKLLGLYWLENAKVVDR